MKIGAKEIGAIAEVSKALGIPSNWLHDLIAFETAGTFNPQIVNSHDPEAKGLIQFRDESSQDLGYRDSADLVSKNPGFEEQLRGPVYLYLRRYAPFSSEQSLYMSVFYPKARTWSKSKEFPPHVQRANPGIVTVGDYVRLVRTWGEKFPESRQAASVALVAMGLIAFGLWAFSKWKNS